ncbi:hypothetical protein HMPREF3291_16205 [Bacillus sp. HMSC76G11]|uniref:hypothetical protein n=1 Tax=Metabacillus idriensis TaxID=324768 RepID=UPI0008A8F9AB|nr:hypothetical protein [Metabacillus idriensis]OHR63603.1 hypothetical protein HMPREF3291_16205 [Bacillus sp. HMSC76G11]
MKQHVLFYSFVFLLCFLLGFIQAPFYLIALLLIFSMSWYMYIQISPILFSKDVHKSEKFILKHQKNPMYQFYYAIANNLDDEAEAALAKFNAKYKNSHRQALINTSFALYRKDVSEAKKHVVSIKPPVYRTYYEALIAAQSRQYDAAKRLAEQLPKGWMKESVLAEISQKQGNRASAKQHAESAYEQTRGLQRYLIYKNNETYFAS